MPNSSSNRTLLIAGSAHSCTLALRELVASLVEKYGLPAHDLAVMDEQGLVRTAATLDFLANNLPPDVDHSPKTPRNA